MKNSIGVKYFAGIIALLMVLTAVTLLAGYQNAKLAVEQQYKRLNAQTVGSISQFTALRLSDINHISSTVGNNNSIIELLRMDPQLAGTEEYRALHAEVERLIADYSWSREYLAIRFDIYVLGYRGEAFSTFYRDKYSLQDIMDQGWYQNLLENRAVATFVPTHHDPEGYGANRYIFQIGRLIYDHITGEPLGVLLLNISEKVLYDCYATAPEADSLYFILDEAGTIISAKDKRCIGLAWAEQFASQPADGPDVHAAPGGGRYYMAASPIGEMGWQLVHLQPVEAVALPTDIIRPSTVVILLLVSIIMVAATRLLTRYLTRPILELNAKMQQVTRGDLAVRATVHSQDEVGQLSASFNEMVTNTERLIEEIRTAEQMRRRSDLNFLRAQINPHFIYNTLDSIRFSVEMGKTEQAQQMLRYFTRLLKHVLASHHDVLPLAEEVESIRNYVQLQSLRYTNSFTVQYNISPEVEGASIPGFILQPIVENAIFYGVEAQHGITTISISAHRHGPDTLHIVVADDGPGMSAEEAQDILHRKERLNSIGVSNVNERIQMCCGEGYGLRITSEKGKGTTVLYVLPL